MPIEQPEGFLFKVDFCYPDCDDNVIGGWVLSEMRKFIGAGFIPFSDNASNRFLVRFHQSSQTCSVNSLSHMPRVQYELMKTEMLRACQDGKLGRINSLWAPFEYQRANEIQMGGENVMGKFRVRADGTQLGGENVMGKFRVRAQLEPSRVFGRNFLDLRVRID